jgi:hypothetical protein
MTTTLTTAPDTARSEAFREARELSRELKRGFGRYVIVYRVECPGASSTYWPVVAERSVDSIDGLRVDEVARFQGGQRAS